MEEECRTNFVECHVGSVPGWEIDRFMRTVFSPLERVVLVHMVTCSTIPWNIRKAVDLTDLEEGLAVVLVDFCKG